MTICAFVYRKCKRALKEWIRANGMPNKVLGPDFWQALAQDSKDKAVSRVMWRHALLKLAYYNSQANLVSVSDIRKSITSRDFQKKVDDFEKFLTRVKDFAKAHFDLKDPHVKRLLGLAECQLVWFVLAKTHRTISWKYDSMEQVGHQFVKLLIQQTGKEVDSPFHEKAGDKGSSAAAGPTKRPAPHL